MKYVPELQDANDKDKYIISSHRRSGSHFFLQVLRENRSRHGMPDGTIRHWKPDHHIFKEDNTNLSGVINIVRDGRDVLVSCYYYYQKIKELEKQFKKASFQDYLYGRVEVKNPDGILKQHWTEQMFYDPIGYWIDFVESWMDVGLMVKFETLLENYPKTPLVGRHKRKGIKGDYLNHFTDKDNNYFLSIAEGLMLKLHYI
jgi:hypothetical protein